MPQVFEKNNQANKRIASNTIFLYIRMLLVMGMSLFTSRVILAELGVTDFGIYNVVGSVVTIFTFISQALGNATNRFIVFSIGRDDVKKTMQVYNTCFRVHLLIAVIVVLLLESVGLWFLNGRLNIPEVRFFAAIWTFHFSVAVCFLSILKVPFNAEIIAHEHMGVYAAISIIETSLKLFIAIILAYSPFDRLVFYAFLFFVVQCIVNLLYYLYCRIKYAECKLSMKIANDKRLYKEIGSFAGWSMFGNIVWLGYTQGINLMLNVFFGPIVNAARGVAVQVEHAISSFVSSFQTALSPQIIKSYAQQDLKRMNTLIMYSAKFSFFLYLIFAVPFFFEAENILKMWLVDVPEHAVNFVRLILVVLLLNPIANPLGVSNDATGKIKKFQIICGLINFQIITISYLCLRYGCAPEIVFVVHALVLTIQTFVKLLFAHNQVGLSLKNYIKTVFMRIVVVGSSSIFLSYLLFPHFGDSLRYMILYIVVSAVSICAISYLMGLDSKEKQLVLSVIKKTMIKTIHRI